VEQVGVDRRLGGLPSQQGKRGTVAALCHTRVEVTFDDDPRPRRLDPSLLQVLEQPTGEAVDPVRELHWHGYIRSTVEQSAPTPADRLHRLDTDPDAVLNSPVAVTEWLVRGIDGHGDRCALWFPVATRWMTYDATDQIALSGEFLHLASRAHSVYAAVWSVGGPRRELFAEAVTATESVHSSAPDTQGGST
jgi:hypothetical protein